MRTLILAGLLCILSACVAPPSPDTPTAYLDQSTAATVTIVGLPLVFARERPNFAAHMRDYITLAAAAVNRSGKVDHVMIAYFWTTFDPHGRERDPASMAPGVDQAPDDLIIVADDRHIHLVRQERSAHDVGIEERVHATPVETRPPTIYRADLATLRFIAASRHLAAQTRTGKFELEYEIWDDRRAALAAWLQALGH